jgi:hypothetical protein
MSQCSVCLVSTNLKCCGKTLYCSVSCQSKDYTRHQPICVRTPGSETDQKRARRTEMTLEDLQRDIFQHLSRFLSLEDLKNLSIVSRQLSRYLRPHYFDQITLTIDPDFSEDMHELLGPFIKSLHFFNIDTLNRWGHKDIITSLTINVLNPKHVLVLPFALEKLSVIICNGIPPRTLPVSLTYLELHGIMEANSFLDIDNLQNLETLIIRNGNFRLKDIPKTVTHLELDTYNEKINLPPKLRLLKLLGRAAGESCQFLPETLEVLEVGGRFNGDVDRLPPNLRTLFLLSCEQPLDNLPNGLETLVIRSDFNHPVDNLPASLKSLTLSDEFNQTLTKLPKSLSFLKLGFGFGESLANLPDSIEYLVLDANYQHHRIPTYFMFLGRGIFKRR